MRVLESGQVPVMLKKKSCFLIPVKSRQQEKKYEKEKKLSINSCGLGKNIIMPTVLLKIVNQCTCIFSVTFYFDCGCGLKRQYSFGIGCFFLLTFSLCLVDFYADFSFREMGLGTVWLNTYFTPLHNSGRA